MITKPTIVLTARFDQFEKTLRIRLPDEVTRANPRVAEDRVPICGGSLARDRAGIGESLRILREFGPDGRN